MYQTPDISINDWPARDRRRPSAVARAQYTPLGLLRRYRLLRWIAILGMIAIVLISIPFAAVLSHFTTREILDHDAALTSQFIASIADTQSSQAGFGARVTLGQVLDERSDVAKFGIDPQAVTGARRQFYDHLRFLPDVLLADVFARDRKVIWSTNRSAIGQTMHDDDGLEKAFASRARVSMSYADRAHAAEEKWFLRQPTKLYVENYIPLYDARGDVAVVAKIYKEPSSLVHSIERGSALVWSCTAVGAVLLYLALFWIIRRADIMLNAQQQRLIESEALCVIGEMSAAVAHGIRNPLASMRSSAELALDGDLNSTRKNATDIIVQIDRLSKWVRELLVFSRPLAGDIQKIDLVSMVEDCLPHFSAQMQKSGIRCEFVRPQLPLPSVLGERALATQALANVVANAIEAMAQGGSLRLEFQVQMPQRQVVLAVFDDGPGMSREEAELVFKPYYTTKRDGLGLGMALVKRIMERFGGSISLHSRKGSGTRIDLSFRVA